MTSNWIRWAPAVAVPAVVVALAATTPFSASAAGDLPEKSASELLRFVADSDVRAFSGTLSQESALGLPDLSALGSASGSAAGDDAATNALELLTGSHEARVYLDADSGARVQILDRLAERDLIATATDVWFYDSGAETAVHTVLPTASAGAEAGASEVGLPDGVATPAELADEFLAGLDPTTSVAVAADTSVAGRDSYELVLTPRGGDTLVGSVTLSIDGETGMPLAVAVTASGATAPAFRVAYTDVSFETPDAELFAFTPPEGTEVLEEAAGGAVDGATVVPDAAAPESDAADSTVPTADARPEVVAGTGWSSVVELPAGSIDPASIEQLTTPSSVGRVLSTALVSVLVADDGRVLAGFVPVDALEAAAGR